MIATPQLIESLRALDDSSAKLYEINAGDRFGGQDILETLAAAARAAGHASLKSAVGNHGWSKTVSQLAASFVEDLTFEPAAE